VDEPPTTLGELIQPEWKGQLTIANPLFGTTATEVSTWYTDWTPENAQRYLKALLANDVIISTGNATAKDMVAAGEAEICLTDTDDAMGAMDNGKPVDIVFLDQEGEGALLIPNTVCLIKGAQNEAEAKALIDFLTSREVEAMLAESRAGQIPLKDGVPAPEPVASWAKMRFRAVDFEEAHGHLEAAMIFVREEFLR
jgi:iron(III) transport system substrate-binding protein